ncbi:MAG: DUF3303 family protein [Candidatus Lokiarchaeia archaeon]
MPRFISIVRWKPETFRALIERWKMVVEGKAPKEVMDAVAKMKILSFEVSLGNQCVFEVFEVDDMMTSDIMSYYISDVCEEETYPVVPLEEAWKIVEIIPKETFLQADQPEKYNDK